MLNKMLRNQGERDLFLERPSTERNGLDFETTHLAQPSPMPGLKKGSDMEHLLSQILGQSLDKKHSPME